MKTVAVFCAVLTFAACAPAASARTRLANPFDGSILRPPASIPHARGATAAAAPLPRPKPLAVPQTAAAAPRATTAETPSGPIVFPPVAPLE